MIMSKTGDPRSINDDDSGLYHNDSEQNSLKFAFSNIGPIREAELELGELTVIAGRNNTGKTYLVYTLYGFLKMSKQNTRLPFDFVSNATDISSIADQLLRSLITSGQARHPVDVDSFNKNRQLMIEYLAHSFSQEGLPNVFSYRPDALEGATLTVQLPHRAPSTSASLKVNLRDGGVLSLAYDGADIVASVDKVETDHFTFDIQHHVLLFLFDFFLNDLPSLPFILSAERFGISLFYRELDFAKNKLVDVLQSMADDREKRRLSPYLMIDSSTSRYALPIKDNIDYTRSLPDMKGQRSEVYDDRLFDDIKDMMDGYYSSSDGDINFISKARKGRTFNIPLHLASSSARGLSDLYFFLRHVARRNQLLMIDEPESHLDTANQMQMARLLSRFVRAGIKVLITTHSDYLIKEFNNLIMLSNAIEGRELVAKELGYGVDDFLLPQSVRAYVAEEEGLRQCNIDHFGIDMPVFDASIDRINYVASELSSRVGDNV